MNNWRETTGHAYRDESNSSSLGILDLTAMGDFTVATNKSSLHQTLSQLSKRGNESFLTRIKDAETPQINFSLAVSKDAPKQHQFKPISSYYIDPQDTQWTLSSSQDVTNQTNKMNPDEESIVVNEFLHSRASEISSQIDFNEDKISAHSSLNCSPQGTPKKTTNMEKSFYSMDHTTNSKVQEDKPFDDGIFGLGRKFGSVYLGSVEGLTSADEKFSENFDVIDRDEEVFNESHKLEIGFSTLSKIDGSETLQSFSQNKSPDIQGVSPSNFFKPSANLTSLFEQKDTSFLRTDRQLSGFGSTLSKAALESGYNSATLTEHREKRTTAAPIVTPRNAASNWNEDDSNRRSPTGSTGCSKSTLKLRDNPSRSQPDVLYRSMSMSSLPSPNKKQRQPQPYPGRTKSVSDNIDACYGSYNPMTNHLHNMPRPAIYPSTGEPRMYHYNPYTTQPFPPMQTNVPYNGPPMHHFYPSMDLHGWHYDHPAKYQFVPQECSGPVGLSGSYEIFAGAVCLGVTEEVPYVVVNHGNAELVCFMKQVATCSTTGKGDVSLQEIGFQLPQPFNIPPKSSKQSTILLTGKLIGKFEAWVEVMSRIPLENTLINNYFAHASIMVENPKIRCLGISSEDDTLLRLDFSTSRNKRLMRVENHGATNVPLILTINMNQTECNWSIRFLLNPRGTNLDLQLLCPTVAVCSINANEQIDIPLFLTSNETRKCSKRQCKHKGSVRVSLKGENSNSELTSLPFTANIKHSNLESSVVSNDSVDLKKSRLKVSKPNLYFPELPLREHNEHSKEIPEKDGSINAVLSSCDSSFTNYMSSHSILSNTWGVHPQQLVFSTTNIPLKFSIKSFVEEPAWFKIKGPSNLKLSQDEGLLKANQTVGIEAMLIEGCREGSVITVSCNGTEKIVKILKLAK